MNYDKAFERVNEYPRYQIYPDGRIIRDAYEDIVRHPKGSFVRPYPEKEVAAEISNCGYARVRLYNRLLERKGVSVHRLVATAFIENLEWVTHAENTQHGFQSGLIKIVYGEETSSSKLTPSQVYEIRERLACGEVQQKIAKEFGVSPSTITSIKKGDTWHGL